MENRITKLKKFVENNLEEKDGGNWEYLIDPIIKDAISEFNESESQIFSTEILNWSEELLYHLADGIIFSENRFIDQDYLYCMIFSKTTDYENGRYLLQNFTAAFQELDSNKYTLEFMESLREKVIQFSKISIEDSHDFNKLFTEKIKNYR